jgi:hypothetical protein
MDTGSDEGEPGGETDTTPLTAEERELLERLRAAGASPAPTPSPTPEAAPPPAAPRREGGGPDPLDPIFREPNP